MSPQDFVCDFCRRAWDGESAMVEGHRGSLICGGCLEAAYRAVVLGDGATIAHGPVCVMCLEKRKQTNWRGDPSGEAAICERCIRQAAQALSKDPDSGWTRPCESS